MTNNSEQSDNSQRDLISSLEKLCNETISTSELERLQDTLKSQPQSRRIYLKYLGMHAQLARIFTPEPVSVERKSSSAPARNLRGSQVSHTTRTWGLVVTTGILVALGIVLTPFFLTRQQPVSDPAIVDSVQQMTLPAGVAKEKPERPVVLSQDAQAVFAGVNVPKLGSALVTDTEFSLVKGAIELAFPDGATAILTAPAVFEINSTTQMKLTFGCCSIYARDGAEGFEVLTPAARVIDLGTRFSVSVDHYGLSDVQVVEGLADVRRLGEDGSLDATLQAGVARRYEVDQSEPGLPIPFDQHVYQSMLADRVISFAGPQDANGDIERLTSITVQRGLQTFTYDYQELIGGDVISVAWTSGESYLIPKDYQGEAHTLCMHDDLLTTGAINPGYSLEPSHTNPVLRKRGDVAGDATPGMAVRFRSPVINGPGPDIVLFDVQTSIDSPDGDAFHVVPMKFHAGLKPITVREFDIPYQSAQASRLVEFQHLTERFLKDTPVRTPYFKVVPLPLRYRAMATGIDLSAMGYAEGESVQEIFIQDAGDDDRLIDPVFIAGFPKINKTDRMASTIE